MNRVLRPSPADRAARRRGACVGALLVALAGPAAAADRAVGLKAQPELMPGIDAMPQIEAPADDAERRINAALRRLDEKVRKAAQACRAEGGTHSDWGRTVKTPMRGPRFLSVEIADGTYCGGPHPNAALMAIVYDLTAGAPVDWTALLPPSLTGKAALETGADGTKMVTLASERLHALYLKGYRPKTGDAKREGDDDECRETVSDTSLNGPPAMMAWLDAGAGGLAVHFDLAHVVQACADTVVIPTAVLRREGAKPALTDALDAAHAKP
ncbi:hypothetical protein MKK69_07555 [Methylobacterium sp. J-026]|uniref:hypothetical protein n=1 Tax=Methylobacterium sp. J-026 TaxID=2836624 RepID=UPI001FBB9991|nr:hypothetical protein [Methylobacterium sp. J-026]MCJ2133927.1 hypothetical protein [Methylobacterium sp. J-026]